MTMAGPEESGDGERIEATVAEKLGYGEEA